MNRATRRKLGKSKSRDKSFRTLEILKDHISQTVEMIVRDRIIYEFIEQGHPRQLGCDLYDGITEDCYQNWSESTFFSWIKQLETIYPSYQGTVLMSAYELISKGMAECTEKLNSMRPSPSIQASKRK